MWRASERSRPRRTRTPRASRIGRRTISDPDDDSRTAGLDDEQRAASRDFTLDIGESRITVVAARAVLAFDRTRAEVVSGAGTSSRCEEILLRPGDHVVGRGTLHRQGDGPDRAAHLSGHVTVVLDARR